MIAAGQYVNCLSMPNMRRFYGQKYDSLSVPKSYSLGIVLQQSQSLLAGCAGEFQVASIIYTLDPGQIDQWHHIYKTTSTDRNVDRQSRGFLQ